MKKAAFLTGCLLLTIGCTENTDTENVEAQYKDELVENEETVDNKANEEPAEEEKEAEPVEEGDEEEKEEAIENNGEPMEDSTFMDKAEASLEALDSYTSETILTVIVNQNGITTDEDSMQMYNTIVREDPPQILVELEDTGIRYYQSYTVDGTVYLHDGLHWIEDVMGYRPEDLSYTEYDNLWEVLERNERHFDMRESGNNTEVSYYGTEGQIYEDFRRLFELDFYGVDNSSVDNDVRYLFDEEAVLREVYYEAKAASDSTNEEVILRVYLRYDDINEAGDLEPPEGIEDLL